MEEFISLVGMSLVVAALIWSFRSTRAWHLLCTVTIAVVKLHAVALIGVGGGLLTCGASSLLVGEAFQIGSPSALMGTGVGLLIGGILLLRITMKASVPQLIPPSEPLQRQPELARGSDPDRSQKEAPSSLETPTAKLASA